MFTLFHLFNDYIKQILILFDKKYFKSISKSYLNLTYLAFINNSLSINGIFESYKSYKKIKKTINY